MMSHVRSESHDDIRSIEDFSDVSSSEEMHEMKQDVHVDHYDINSITEQFSHVNVALRLSHIPDSELKTGARTIIKISDRDTITAVHPESGQTLDYKFDYCFDSNTDTSEIFNTIGQPILQSVMAGFNSAIVSYGPSNTKKSHMFYGDPESDYPGLVELVLKNGFHLLESSPPNIRYSVTFSYWEMNEKKVIDLLSDDPSDMTTDLSRNINHAYSKKERKVRHHPEVGVYITNLTMMPVECWEDLEDLIRIGNERSGTLNKSRGIRWHSFIRLNLQREDENEPQTTIKSSLLFVNLKGSERIGQKGARGKQLKQGSSLNMTMTAFGNAVHNVVNFSRVQLRQGNDPMKTISELPGKVFNFFGDSKVTAVLSEALGGSYATTIVGSICPSEYHYIETMEAIENLSTARHIYSVPTVGIVDTKVRRLYQQLKSLEEQLPIDSLAEGHPLTEQQEQFLNLKDEYEHLINGIPYRRRDSEPNAIPNMRMPKNHQTWKKNDAKSQKHGDRHTVYIPRRGGSKSTFRGQWKLNEKSGVGVYESKNIIYDGQWFNNVRHGTQGTLYRKNEKGEKRREYIGGWKNDKKHGRGVHYYENGDIYDGEWACGVRCGQGTMYYSDGTKYEGEWKGDKLSGFGITFETNGDRYEGYHANGKRNGSGTMHFVSSRRLYKGEWFEGTAKSGEIMAMDGEADDVFTLPPIQVKGF